MPRRLTFRREVENDVLSIIEYIERDSIQAADRFGPAAMEACYDLVSMPGKGSLKRSRRGARAELRSWSIPSFPNHLILYEVRPDRIQIIAITHGARDIRRLLRERR